MLVLTRELDEEICIGDNVILKVVSLENGKVRLGFIAPKDIIIDRREIRDKKDYNKPTLKEGFEDTIKRTLSKDG